MKKIARKGFTLIELLIVIVVIAVLSSMMILSSLEATYTAEANNIIVALVQIKKAFHMWCMDHPDSLDQMITVANTKNGILQNVLGANPITMKTAFWNEVMSYLQKPSEPELNHYYQQLDKFEFMVGEGDITGKVKKDSGLYVRYNINGKTIEKQKLAAKLAGRAKSVGLLGDRSMDVNNKNPVYDGVNNNGLKYVYYRIF